MVVAVLGCCIVTARTLQGMARARSGQAPAWPVVSDPECPQRLQCQASLCVYVDQALYLCASSRGFQWRLMLEERTRTLRGPSPDPGLTRLCTVPVGSRWTRWSSPNRDAWQRW